MRFALLGFVGLCACGGGPVTASAIGSLDTANMLPVTDAITIASNELPGGFIVSAQLDLEDVGGENLENEPLSYEVAIYTADTGQLWHVGVDAKTGDITEKEIEDGPGKVQEAD